MSKILDMLLRPDCPNAMKDLPTKQYEVKRLSELCGEPAVLTLRGLSYNTVQTIRDMPDNERNLQIILAGCVDPNFRDPCLSGAGTGCPTPVDAIKRSFNSGEIDDIAAAVERLSGYRTQTIAEVKNA